MADNLRDRGEEKSVVLSLDAAWRLKMEIGGIYTLAMSAPI